MVARIGRDAGNRRPEKHRAIGRDRNHASQRAMGRTVKPRRIAGELRPTAPAIHGVRPADRSAVIKQANTRHHRRIRFGKVQKRAFGHPRIEERGRRDGEIVVPETALVPHTAQQMRARGRADQRKDHGLFDAVRANLPVSVVQRIKVRQILRRPHCVASLKDGVIGVKRVNFQSSGPHPKGRRGGSVVHPGRERTVQHRMLQEACPGHSGVGAAVDGVSRRSPAVPRGSHHHAIVLRIRGHSAESVP